MDSPLPDDTVERLLDGRVDDPSLAPVARFLRLAAGDLDETIDGPPEALLDAMVTTLGVGGMGAVVPIDEVARRRRRRIVTIALTAGALGLSATGAAAVSGSLPDAVQDAVHDIAHSVGIDLPEGSQDGPGHGRSDEAPGRPAVPGQPADPGRSDEAPGRPTDPGNGQGTGVGSEGTPPGQGGTVPATGEPPGPGEEPGPPDETGGEGDEQGNSGDTPGDTSPGSTAPGRPAPDSTAPDSTAPGSTAPARGR